MTRKIQTLALTEIRPGNNDRTEFKHQPLIELAGSIAKSGLAQPITVRPVPPDLSDVRYEVVAGERRLRACKMYTELVQSNQWEASSKIEPGTITAIVREMSDDEAAEIMLIENLVREDLDPIDEANAYARRLGAGWTKMQLAEVANTSNARINSRLKLLELAPDIQHLVRNGQIALFIAEEMSVLDFNRQRIAARWLNNLSYTPTHKMVAEFVGRLFREQAQDTLFDLGEIFHENQLKVMETNGARVSHSLPAINGLPGLPKKDGKIGAVIDAYATELIQTGNHGEARVVLDLWKKLMQSNYAQVDPWDCETLTVLGKLNGHNK